MQIQKVFRSSLYIEIHNEQNMKKEDKWYTLMMKLSLDITPTTLQLKLHMSSNYTTIFINWE